MKKKYTKKQIMEAIKYWQGVLKTLNENSATDEIDESSKLTFRLEFNDYLGTGEGNQELTVDSSASMNSIVGSVKRWLDSEVQHYKELELDDNSYDDTIDIDTALPWPDTSLPNVTQVVKRLLHSISTSNEAIEDLGPFGQADSCDIILSKG